MTNEEPAYRTGRFEKIYTEIVIKMVSLNRTMDEFFREAQTCLPAGRPLRKNDNMIRYKY